MRVLVCGGRNFTDQKYVNKRLLHLFLNTEYTIDTIIHGGASGADVCAGRWAKKYNIDVIVCPADWDKLGSKAGPIRNSLMLKKHKPDLVIAFPGGSGTEDMIRKARAANIDVYIYSNPKGIK